MELLDKRYIFQRNDEAYPVETEYVNRFGNRVILPAHSTLFQEVFDTDGFPIFEFMRNEYYDEEGEVLISSKALDEKIEARENTADVNLDKQPRVVAISLYFRDRRTGEKFFIDEEELKSFVDMSTSSLVAFGLHDRDQYLEEDEAEEVKALTKAYHNTHTSDEGLEAYLLENRTIFAGNQKGRHIHIDLAGERGRDGKRKKVRVSTLCKKLHCRSSAMKFVKESGGNDGFLDQIRYLTHETEQAQEDGKFLYPKSIIYANFNCEEALQQREEEEAKYGKNSPSLWQKWKHDVMLEGKSLKACEEEDWDLFSDKKKKLEELRSYYLLKKAPTPPIRLSYYIDAVGAVGGEGKSSCAKCFARVLAHDEFGAPMDVPFEQLDEYIYFISDPKVSMQHYDGQPIVLFNDFKAGDILTAFKSRDALKNFLDPYPEKCNCDIKYGDAVLIPKYVIINGIQSYEEFIDKLASTKSATDEEESKQQQQFERRFFGRIIIDTTVSALRLMVNSDYLEDTPEKKGFLEVKTMKMNMRRLLENFDINNEQKISIEKSTFLPLVEKTATVVEAKTHKSNSLTDEFADYGKEVSYDELIKQKESEEALMREEREALLQAEKEVQEQTEKEREERKFKAWLSKLSPEEVEQVKKEHEEEMAELFTFDD